MFEVSFLAEIGIEMWRILLDSAPYIVLGILVAGFIKIFVNQKFILNHLRRGRFRSVIKAALFGVPLPL